MERASGRNAAGAVAKAVRVMFMVLRCLRG